MKIEDIEAFSAKAAKAAVLKERIAALTLLVDRCKPKTRLVLHYYGDTKSILSAGCGYVTDVRDEAAPLFWSALQVAVRADLEARLKELEAL